MWDVEVTDEFRGWYLGLDDDAADAVGVAVDVAAMAGPAMPAIRAAAATTVRLRVATRGGPPQVTP